MPYRIARITTEPAIADLPRSVRAEIRRSLHKVRTEFFWPLPAIWLGFILLLIAAGAWDMWRFLPRLAPLSVWAIGLSALAVFSVIHLRRRPRPSWQSACSQLEIDNQAKDRPFAALQDHPLGADATNLHLWQLHRDSMLRSLEGLRAKPPRRAHWPIHAGGLGALLACILMSIFFSDPRLWRDRVVRSLWPDFGVLIGADKITLEAWANPPNYSDRAPIFLSPQTNGPWISVPAGTQLLIRAKNGPKPSLLIRSGGKSVRVLFVPSTKSGKAQYFEAKTVLKAQSVVQVRAWGTRAQWRFKTEPDAPPRIEFVKPPRRGKRDHLVFDWKASDDFGVAAVFLEIAPLRGARKPIERVPVPLPGVNPTTIEKAMADLDLIRSAYAGSAVKVRLVARDAIDQEGFSDYVELTLPQRTFVDPLALAVLEIRSTLIQAPDDWPLVYKSPAIYAAQIRLAPGFMSEDQNPRLSRAPADVKRAARMLDAITLAPQQLWVGYAPYMALRHARATMELARNKAETNPAADLLWEAALAIEGSGLTDAQQKLAEAKAALQKAIEAGASQEELDDRLDDYQAAFEAVLREKAEQALAAGLPSPDPNAQGANINQQDIAQMIEELREIAKNGSPEEAREALEALSELLANLQFNASNSAGGIGTGQNAQNGESREKQQLREFSDLLGEQRSLNEQTFQRDKSGQPGTDLAQAQRRLGDRLRQTLRDAERDAGGQARAEAAPDDSDPDPQNTGRPSAQAQQALRQAEQAMRLAEEALKSNDLDAALQAQSDALQALRRGSEDLARNESQRRRGQGQGQRDPLGRRAGGQGDDSDGNKIPGEAEKRRAQEIQDEIRRRAGEATRPAEERDYLKRLLQPF